MWKLGVQTWVEKALQTASVDSASPLNQSYIMSFEAYDAKKTNDEEEAVNPEQS